MALAPVFITICDAAGTCIHCVQVTLTLMGDSASIPWRLLDISFQVEDHETGSESPSQMSCMLETPLIQGATQITQCLSCTATFWKIKDLRVEFSLFRAAGNGVNDASAASSCFFPWQCQHCVDGDEAARVDSFCASGTETCRKSKGCSETFVGLFLKIQG